MEPFLKAHNNNIKERVFETFHKNIFSLFSWSRNLKGHNYSATNVLKSIKEESNIIKFKEEK